MKKYNKKLEEILKIDNLLNIYYNIKLNTKHKAKLITYEMFLSANLHMILNKLMHNKYNHGKYNIFLIKENKYRIIMSESLSDKIVNHLISVYVLNDAIDRRLLDINVATRKEKGTKAGINYLKKYINSIKENHNDIYVLKCDIKKYFYNIDHEILISKLNNIITDKNIKQIIFNIINSTNENYVNETITKIILKEKDIINKSNKNDKKKLIDELDSIPLYKYNKGLPIGNLTSQILAVYYLNDLDHFIKEKLKIKGYIRYMDDFILIHHDKQYLKYCLSVIEDKLSDLKLCLNNKTKIYNLKYGINFLGYKFRLVNKKLSIRILYKNKIRIIRRLKSLQKKDIEKFKRSYASYLGYIVTNKNLLYTLKKNINICCLNSKKGD